MLCRCICTVMKGNLETNLLSCESDKAEVFPPIQGSVLWKVAIYDLQWHVRQRLAYILASRTHV